MDGRTEPQRALRRLEWRLRRRVSTVLVGDHRSVFHGKGMEFDQVVKYAFGDDVRAIDWNVTARLGEPYRKLFVEERDVPIVVTFADDPALRFGSGATSKRERLLDLAGLILMLGIFSRQRVSLVHVGAGGTTVHPPTRRRERVMAALMALFAAPLPDAMTRQFDVSPLPPGPIPNNALLVWLGEIPLSEPSTAWAALRRSHRCVGIRVEDAWERALPRHLSGTVFDPATGRAVTLGDGDDETHAAWRARREARWARWWPDPADRLVVDSAADPLAALVAFLTRRRSLR